MRYPSFTPKKIDIHGNERWQINIPENYTFTGERERPSRKTKAEAEVLSKQLKDHLRRYGKSLPILSEEQHREYLRAVQQLRPLGIGLAEAVESFVSHQQALDSDITYGELLKKVLLHKGSEGKSKIYLSDLKLKGSRFIEHFGDKKLREIRPLEIDNIVGAFDLSVNSKRSYKRNLKVIFSQAIEWNLITTNPVSKVAKEKLPSRSIEIFAVDQVEKLLENASQELLPYYVLGTFCGIRPNEIAGLDWKDINFDKRTVEVKAKVSKTNKRRFVTIEPAPMAWLSTFRGSTGKLTPKNFRKKFDADRKSSGMFDEWKHDVLRHTFASYHAAFYTDLAKTAYELGHSDLKMLEEHYREAVEDEQAERFWNIFPKDFKGNKEAASSENSEGGNS